MSKGKASSPYECGVKVGIAVSARKGLIVGARSFPGHPYDGDTLAEQLEQARGLLQDVNVIPQVAIVDLGYRGRDVEGGQSQDSSATRDLSAAISSSIASLGVFHPSV